MSYFKPSSYSIENAIKEAVRYYDGIYVGDYITMKDHGNYIQVNVDADNSKGHISFDVFYDDSGSITRVEKHR